METNDNKDSQERGKKDAEKDLWRVSTYKKGTPNY